MVIYDNEQKNIDNEAINMQICSYYIHSHTKKINHVVPIYPTQKSDSINTYIWPQTGTLKTKEILEPLNFDGNHTLSWLCNPTKVDGFCQNESGPIYQGYKMGRGRGQFIFEGAGGEVTLHASNVQFYRININMKIFQILLGYCIKNQIFETSTTIWNSVIQFFQYHQNNKS